MPTHEKYLKMTEEQRARKRETQRIWFEKNREKRKEYRKRQMDKPGAREQKNAKNRAWWHANKERETKKQLERRRKRMSNPIDQEAYLAYLREYYKTNKDRLRAQNQEWKSVPENMMRVKAWYKNWKLQRKYGWDITRLLNELEACGYKCQICGDPIDENTRNIDHDHQTERVRGLLCRMCNYGLGHFKDSPALLIGAAQYLWAHKMPRLSAQETAEVFLAEFDEDDLDFEGEIANE